MAVGSHAHPLGLGSTTRFFYHRRRHTSASIKSNTGHTSANFSRIRSPPALPTGSLRLSPVGNERVPLKPRRATPRGAESPVDEEEDAPAASDRSIAVEAERLSCDRIEALRRMRRAVRVAGFTAAPSAATLLVVAQPSARARASRHAPTFARGGGGIRHGALA